MEARLRQLEGRLMASEAAAPRGKPDAPRYDPQRQGPAGAALLAQPRTYNPNADVTADASAASAKKPVLSLRQTQSK